MIDSHIVYNIQKRMSNFLLNREATDRHARGETISIPPLGTIRERENSFSVHKGASRHKPVASGMALLTVILNSLLIPARPPVTV